MTWTPITDAEMAMARHVVTWIRVAREAGYGGPNWLPSDADISKSALLERLRSGKEPLAEPPPLGLSCPWYALVEDPGPHYVMDVWRGEDVPALMLPPNAISALQHLYSIVETRGVKDFIVRDACRDTSYRFRLWFDAEWTHPSHFRGKGGWFLQNVAFDQSRAEPEKPDPEQQDEKCGACHGSGRYMGRYGHNDPDCPDCNGTGWADGMRRHPVTGAIIGYPLTWGDRGNTCHRTQSTDIARSRTIQMPLSPCADLRPKPSLRS